MSRSSNMQIPMSMFKYGESGFKLMTAYINTMFAGNGAGIRLTTPGEPEPQPCKDCAHCPAVPPPTGNTMTIRCYPQAGGTYRSISLGEYVGGQAITCRRFSRKPTNTANEALETLREAVCEHLDLGDDGEDDDADGWSDEFLADDTETPPSVSMIKPFAPDEEIPDHIRQHAESLELPPYCDWCRYYNIDGARRCCRDQSPLVGQLVDGGPGCYRYEFSETAHRRDQAANGPPVTTKGGYTTVTWKGSVHDTIIALLDAAREMAAKANGGDK